LADKWRAFGWQVIEVDGHDHAASTQALAKAHSDDHRPAVLICETIKGKGVSFMEDQVLWHYRPPTREQATKGIAEVLADRGNS